jgi:hypothetical protein
LVQYIDDGTDIPHRKIRKALTVDVGIDTLYTQVLSAVPRGHNFQRVIGTIMLLREPLSITSLGRLLQLETADVLHALLGVQSILLIPGDDDDCVRLFHTSLQDFLTTKSRSREFFVDPPNHHILIATDCLKSITILSKEIIFMEEPQRYASHYWLDHVIESIELGVDDFQIHPTLTEFMCWGFEKWINFLIFSRLLINLIGVLSSLISKLKVSSLLCHLNLINDLISMFQHMNECPQDLLYLFQDLHKQTKVESLVISVIICRLTLNLFSPNVSWYVHSFETDKCEYLHSHDHLQEVSDLHTTRSDQKMLMMVCYQEASDILHQIIQTK